MSRVAWVAASAVIFASAVLVSSVQSVSADDSSNEPYIDQIRKTLPPEQNSQSYIDSIKGKLAPDTSAGYTEKLKESLEQKGEAAPSKGYTEEIRHELTPEPSGGAIEAVREGHSQLKMIKSLDIHNAFGIRVGMGASRNITAGPQISAGGSFNSIYGASWAPDVALFYEDQFWRNEVWGSLGVFGMGSVAFFNGTGAFTVPINNAATGGEVTQSQTALRFYEVPWTAGLSYRTHLSKYVSPYFMAGPSVIGGAETRNDGKPTHFALSGGYWGAAGVEILMDWVSRTEEWNRYTDFSIKHTYLTLEYNTLQTLSFSPIIYSTNGIYAGFTFEF